MTHPRPPRVRAKTDAEKDRDARRARALEFVQQARQRISNREAGETISPYDLMSEVLFNLISDAIFAQLHAPDFEHDLRKRGYAIVPAYPAGDVPDPPADWADDALNLFAFDGTVADPVGLIDELWSRAWLAGRESRDAGE